ncbi:Haloacid dehalogenase-like hydrolase (HAD) superfamily protein [Raphanus sativus]|nr:Haloacid dehalogenase-like hydrolase (HAD) superfamily protein [Raphanus sativus]
MAKEMKKKSIIASDDEVDKHLCITDSEQTELSSILDTLSLGPTKENKKLLIFSPSGILLHRGHRKNRNMMPKNCCPDASHGSNLVYKRPFTQEFIKFCLERLEVGIWSSAWESNVDIILDIALEDLKDKLLFVWGQQQCTDTGLNTLKHKGMPLFFKDLSKVFQRFKEFSVLNTVFIDDEPDKALLNPDNAGVFPVTYDPLDKNDDFLGKF